MLTIMRNKDIKQVLSLIKEQFGCGIKGEHLFLISKNDKVYVTNPELREINTENLKINNTGSYFGKIERAGFRLSIEGSEILDNPKKNILELTDEEFQAYMAGENLMLDEKQENAYKIIKYKKHFIGCGRVSNNVLLNYIPKARRAKENN
jgi:NOL1/NOP2/fmu family ribosome biogenesis protein